MPWLWKIICVLGATAQSENYHTDIKGSKQKATNQDETMWITYTYFLTLATRGLAVAQNLNDTCKNSLKKEWWHVSPSLKKWANWDVYLNLWGGIRTLAVFLPVRCCLCGVWKVVSCPEEQCADVRANSQVSHCSSSRICTPFPFVTSSSEAQKRQLASYTHPHSLISLLVTIR